MIRKVIGQVIFSNRKIASLSRELVSNIILGVTEMIFWLAQKLQKNILESSKNFPVACHTLYFVKNTPKFGFFNCEAVFSKKKLFLSTFYVLRKGSFTLHKTFQNNIWTLVNCSLSLGIHNNTRKIDQKHFLKKSCFRQAPGCYKNDFSTRTRNSGNTLEPNKNVTWGLS